MPPVPHGFGATLYPQLFVSAPLPRVFYRSTVEQRWAIILRSIILLYIILTLWQSGMKVKYVTTVPLSQPPHPQFDVSFPEKLQRSLLLEARFLALNKAF